jgi:hypothetical protein
MESNRSQLDLRSRRRSAVFRAWVGFFGQVVAICMLGIGARLSATDLGPVVREGAQVRLGWTNAPGLLQLQESDSPVGPWTNLGDPASTNSVLINPVATQRFFRTLANAGTTNAAEAAMRATLKAVGDFVNSVPRDNPSLWRSQVLTFLQARPDIDSAGESPDGVWAFTRDGIPLCLWNNRGADPAGLISSERLAEPQGTATPGGSPARFSVTVGSGFVLAAPRLGGLLRANGYQTTTDDGALASMKGVHSESAYFLNTHGGAVLVPLFGNDGKPSRNAAGKILYYQDYGLWTGTKIDPVKTDVSYRHDEFVSDLKAGRMAVALAPASYTMGTGGVQSPNNEWHFCVTAAWVRANVRFPAENHASVWLAVCRSGSAAAKPLRDAFRAVGAEMVSGWTEDVNGQAVLAATPFVWDRMLGANQILPPATPQRPFDYENAWTELRTRGLHRHATRDPQGNPTTTDLIYEGTPGDERFGVFAPSIEYVLVSESTDEIHLIGLFGVPPADARKVLIGGSDAVVVSWEPRKVICQLQRNGAGSAGDVQVIVREHRSNIRRITRWTLTGTFRQTERDSAHRIDGTVSLIFRADIGEYRKVPGNVFIRPTRSAQAAKDSKVYLEAKGIDSSPCDQGSDRVIWEGSGEWKVRGFNEEVTDPAHTLVMLSVNTIDRVVGLGLAFGLFDIDASPMKVRVEPCAGSTVTFPLPPATPGDVDNPPMFKMPLEDLLPDGSVFEIPLPGTETILSADNAIPAGFMENDARARLEWNSAAAEFAPDPNAAR